MAEFITTLGISFQIENIIKNARNKLVLVSPYLQLSPLFFDRLKDATQRGVMLKVVFGKNELDPSKYDALSSLANIELFFYQNLHAKCYFNERTMVITSMNMYEFSEKNNREMGIFIDRSADAAIFNKAVEETLSIVSSAQNVTTTNGKTYSYPVGRTPSGNSSMPGTGFCIRCDEPINYNPAKPLCASCLGVWSYYGDIHYLEQVCHQCGKPHDTSMAKPECRGCYQRAAVKQS